MYVFGVFLVRTFSHFWTENRDLQIYRFIGLQNKSPYSVQMLENKDQKNSEYVKFARGVKVGDSYFELLN